MKWGTMPILLWVSEDETLRCHAVTIIATDLILNNGIVNTEPKKIIHTLEDEQRSVHNLSQNTVQGFDLNAEKTVSDSEARVDLMEDSVAPEAAVPVAGNEELMMSEFIRNLDVSFEIVSPAKGIDFTTPKRSTTA
jgi:cell division protein FtsZ